MKTRLTVAIASLVIVIGPLLVVPYTSNPLPLVFLSFAGMLLFLTSVISR